MDAKQCGSLQEIRDEIDLLDDRIIEMLALRSQYVSRAAHFKHSVDEIKSNERVEAVFDRVRHKAAALGISPNLVLEVYRLLIDKMVEMEIEEYSNLKAF